MHNAPKIREFEKKYIQRLEELTGQQIDNERWWDYLSVFFDWYEEEEEGSPERREALRQERRAVIQYVAYLLRHDLDGSWHLHPYPRPVTHRLKKVWKLAQYFYDMDDPNGFLGPASGEVVYIARAISASAIMGHTDFDDILPKLAKGRWWADTYDTDLDKARQDDDFIAWLDAGEFDWMFNHRGTKEEWETRSHFVDHDGALRRSRVLKEYEKEHEQEREDRPDATAVCASE